MPCHFAWGDLLDAEDVGLSSEVWKLVRHVLGLCKGVGSLASVSDWVRLVQIGVAWFATGADRFLGAGSAPKNKSEPSSNQNKPI